MVSETIAKNILDRPSQLKKFYIGEMSTENCWMILSTVHVRKD